MKVTWTCTFTTDFNLDQAVEDYNLLIEHPYNVDPDKAIYDAVEANWACDGEEYIDTSEAIKICADALRQRIGGIQMRMELN